MFRVGLMTSKGSGKTDEFPLTHYPHPASATLSRRRERDRGEGSVNFFHGTNYSRIGYTQPMGFHVYILECRDGTYYTGMTNNLLRRLKEHNAKRGGRYTRGKTPVTLKYAEPQETFKEAMVRELEIKRWPRLRKQRLVDGVMNVKKAKNVKKVKTRRS